MTDWDALLVSLGLRPSSPAPRSAEVRAAQADRVRRQRQLRAERGLPADDPRHGKPSTYTNWGCRCPKCRAANTADVAPRMAALRARRRLAA